MKGVQRNKNSVVRNVEQRCRAGGECYLEMHKGHKMSEVHKRQISKSKTGSKQTPETIEKIRATMTATAHKKERMFWIKKLGLNESSVLSRPGFRVMSHMFSKISE